MAAILVGIQGTPSGYRQPLMPGAWALQLDSGRPVLAPADSSSGAVRFEVGAKAVVLVPGTDASARVNDAPLDGPRALAPGDVLAVGFVTLKLERGAASVAEAAAEAAVALPPPEPSKWRWLLGLLGIGVAAAAVALVFRYLPDHRNAAVRALSNEVRLSVQRSAVWIRAVDRGSEGSGFVCRQGWVLTNAHVVDGAQSVKVVFDPGTAAAHSAPATVTRTGTPGTDQDMALLRVDTGATPALNVLPMDKLAPGTPIVAFGYPLGSELGFGDRGPEVSVRGGTVTALRRRGDAVAWVESDMPIEVGNSGGPVVTLDGRVVGLATMIVGPNLRTALAVSTDMLRGFAPEAVTVAP